MKKLVIDLDLIVQIFKMDKILILMILEILINQIFKVLQMLLDLMKLQKQRIFGFTSTFKRREKKKDIKS